MSPVRQQAFVSRREEGKYELITVNVYEACTMYQRSFRDHVPCNAHNPQE